MLIALCCVSPRVTAAQNAPARPTPEVQALLDKGDQARRAYRWEEAQRLYGEAHKKAQDCKDGPGEGKALHNEGVVYWRTGQPQKALKSYEQALTIQRAVRDRVGEAGTLQDIGSVYADTGQPKEALEHYLLALPIQREAGNRPDEAMALASIGSVYADIGQPQKAIEYYQQALPIVKAIGSKKGEAYVLNMVGAAYWDTGMPGKALQSWQEALAIHKDIGDKGGQAAALSTIGNVYLNRGQLQEALKFYLQALPLHREVGNRQFEATTLNNIGTVCLDTGELQKALAYYLQALPIYSGIGDRLGEARMLTNVGNVYLSAGQPQTALEFEVRALPMYRDVGNRPGEAYTLNRMGSVCSETGQSQKALAYYLRALPIARGSGDRGDEARSLAGIAVVYFNTGKPKKALDYFRRSMVIRKDIGDVSGQSAALRNIGSALWRMGERQRAMEVYRQARSTYHATGDRQAEALTLHSIAIVDEKEGRLAAAQQNCQRAVQLIENVRENIGGLSEVKTAFLASHMGVYRRLVHVLLRENKIEEAFRVAQKTKARALLDLMSSGRVVLNASLTVHERDQEQELRGHAELLNRQMVREGVNNALGAKRRFAALQVQLRQAESDLQTFEDSISARHPHLARKRAAAAITLPELARLLPSDTALLEYTALNNERDEKSNGFALFVITVHAGHADVAAYNLPIITKALIGKVDAFRAACADPRRPYRSRARALYRLLIAPAAKQLAGKKRLIICPDGPLWNVPFAALTPPMVNRIGIHTSRYALTGGQEPKGRAPFLAERFEIAYAYSATGMQATLLASRQPGRVPPTRTLLVMANPDFGGEKRFGDNPEIAGQRPITAHSRPIVAPSRPIAAPSRPIVAPSRPIVGPSRPIVAPSRPIVAPSRPIVAPSRDLYLPRGGHLTALNGTQREAEALQRIFPDAVLYLGKNAQRATALAEAGRYRYLHFATHGFFNDAAPMLSSIVLADPPARSDDDGFLTARDIFELNLSAELVVLSACDSARGEQRSGEGIVGLTWALFVAGAPTQVLSQWGVDDASTARLMEEFYRRLKRGEAKGAALRQAALSLMRLPSPKSTIDNRKYSHPYYWAPFILVGDWRK